MFGFFGMHHALETGYMDFLFLHILPLEYRGTGCNEALDEQAATRTDERIRDQVRRSNGRVPSSGFSPTMTCGIGSMNRK